MSGNASIVELLDSRVSVTGGEKWGKQCHKYNSQCIDTCDLIEYLLSLEKRWRHVDVEGPLEGQREQIVSHGTNPRDEEFLLVFFFLLFPTILRSSLSS